MTVRRCSPAICLYCGVDCQIELVVKNNRIVRTNGVAGEKPNDGRLCVKGRFGYEFVGSQDRLTRPLINRNGQFVNRIEGGQQAFEELKKLASNYRPDNVSAITGIDLYKILAAARLYARIGLTPVEIMQAAHDGKVKGMYIMGENPMLTDPNQNHTREALEALDFLVVQDISPTETTRYADVVLPGVAFAEKNGTFVNSDRRVGRVRKAVDPPGKARQDWEVIWEMAKRMGCPIKSYPVPYLHHVPAQ